MKAKNILMSILLAVGSIAAKAATGYPPELALVSQPVMVYNYNSITVYYDVENIGDYTYRGNVYLYLDPDFGYYYADKYVKVSPGAIKRIAINIPSRRIDKNYVFTIMPYYEMGDELYSFTTFEYFEPLSFYWRGLRNERWVVISAPPRIRVYTRPGHYRYYYDGFRPPMPPPPPAGHAHGPGTPPPPMNPMHHTYNYHHNNGGYPATHEVTPPAPHNGEPAPNNGGAAPSATVRPKTDGGSMSSGNNHSGNSNPPAPTPNNGGSVKPNGGRTPSNGSSSGNVSRPGNSNNNSGVGRPNNNGSSGRTGNSGVSRPSSSNSGTSTRPTTNGSNVSRPSRSSGSSSGTTRGAGSSSAGSSSSNSRSAGTNSSSSRNNSSSGSSSSSRSGSGANRR